jgi:uncharacterized protein YprB with RNaseH-like and TPR domain
LSSFADRIRGVVGATNPGARVPIESRIPPPSLVADSSSYGGPVRSEEGAKAGNPQSPDLSALGGVWRDDCFVVERRKEPAARHGREAVGTLAECLDESAAEAALYSGGADARAPFVFFDLETTGLSGGAGTQAFLVGCGWFDHDASFVTRQFLLTRYTDERPMLDTVAVELARAGALVSFNGKSFDAPLLETRYLFHRLAWNGRQLPHVDVLHPARRFWNRAADGARAFRTDGARASRTDGARASRTDGARAFQASGEGCSLATLEKQILGVRRAGDVPGFEIPGRYFQFVRTGDARPLAHNRLDLLSLAALAARLFHVTRHGPDAARDAREALALGHVYMRGGLTVRACDAFRRAVEMTERGAVSQLVRIESLRALALSHRRARQHADAAACWRRLVEAPGCPPRVVREATEALAVHHEHRERDLETAKTFALRGLDLGSEPVWVDAARYRLARLDRKLAAESLKSEVRSLDYEA